MHRGLIIGAGRIGAGFQWNDDAYTHAGAYRALKDRIELVGFVEQDSQRALAAHKKWGLPVWLTLKEFGAADVKGVDIVSVCVQPDQQFLVLSQLDGQRGIWCEKPYVSPKPMPGNIIQVNYLRRANNVHQYFAKCKQGGKLIVFGKDDIHTRCHFEDLAKWWGATLEYHAQNTPCTYYYQFGEDTYPFKNGGLERPGDEMRGMLANLLDHVEGKGELWSPAA